MTEETMVRTELDSSIERDQYLTFTLGDELYSVSVFRVREVLEFQSVTKVPRMPEFMRGVVNIRGTVVPVIDLNLKFGGVQTEKTVDTGVIVMEIGDTEDPVVVGILADSVHEVVSILADQIAPAPKIGTQVRAEFLDGVGKCGDEMVLMLNMDRVFSDAELEAVSQ
jgi:purine-binding chemotaxis protein CheW